MKSIWNSPRRFLLPTSVAVAGFGLLSFLYAGLEEDQWQFEGGFIREWWFRQITFIGKFDRVEPNDKATKYYIRYPEGTAAQAASMEYVSRRSPNHIADAFRGFCNRNRLTISDFSDERTKAGKIELLCMRPGESYISKFEGSYLSFSAEPLDDGTRVTVTEFDMKE
jgi:hypothetical protein